VILIRIVGDVANANQDRALRRIIAAVPRFAGERTATWIRSKLVVRATSLVGPVV